MTFGSRGSQPGLFTWPRGIAVGPDNAIVVADSSNHRVQVFNEHGQHRFRFELIVMSRVYKTGVSGSGSGTSNGGMSLVFAPLQIWEKTKKFTRSICVHSISWGLIPIFDTAKPRFWDT